MIQEKDYFGRWINHPEVTEQVKKNARVLIAKVSELLSRAGIQDILVTSGFRPHAYNAQINGAKNSHHCFGNAVDLWDPDKKIGEFCQVNIEQLAEIGLWIESLSRTHASDRPQARWCHLQRVAPRSGARIFLP
jgi:hypothetical protein